MKKLAVATLAVLGLLVLIYMQIREPAAAVTSPQAAVAAPTPVAAAQPSELATAAKKIAEAQAQSGKLDPASDAFFYRFDEAIPGMLTPAAASCYSGGLQRVHRNQKIKLGYTIKIKDGVVSVSDVKVIETTVNNKKMEDCMVKQVAQVTWRDDELPDWQQEHEELVIRPERGMKKYTKENLAYDGEGPIGKLETTGPVAASRELPKN